VERRTYVSTKGPQAEITLFRDVTVGPEAQSSTVTHKLEHSKEPVVYMGTVTATRDSAAAIDTLDLLIVKRDGEIQCLDGDKLQEKWTSPASALGRDATTPLKDAKVEFAQLTNAYTASQGILKDHQGVFSLFPQEISEDGFNPDILVVITRSEEPTPSRNVHVVALPRKPSTSLDGLGHSVESLLTASLPSPSEFQEKASFSIHVSAGIIQQLSSNILTTFSMNDTLPTELSQLKVKGAKSFLRLSNTSIMVSTGTVITVYSPKFQSIMASIKVPSPWNTSLGAGDETEEVEDNIFNLVSYFPKLNTAVAIADNDLVAIQIEGKSRAAGLLIDSLGCSVLDQMRPGRTVSGSTNVGLITMGSYLPGSIGMPEKSWKQEKKAMDAAASAGDIAEFEAHMAERLGESWGDKVSTNEKPRLNPSEVDRRWVIYALTKIFAWSNDDNGEYKLTIPFYPPNVFMWLLKTGNMTVANIELAVRNQIRPVPLEFIPAGQLVDALVELDPTMDLLRVLVSRNFLGAAELLGAIRVLMESLELFGEGAAAKQKLLTNGEELHLEDGDVEEHLTALEAEAEADLAMAEYQLGPGSGVRGEALSIALSKLYTCPTNTIVYALQTTFTTQEVVSLIYLLRFELARGGWTSRYLDDEQLDIIDNEAGTPDNTILVISSLLNNCVDAVGAGGWLSGDARLVNGDSFEAEELISSLKLEVSAALEGVEEAVYLKGLTSEMIRYGNAVHKAYEPREPAAEGPSAKKHKTSHKPVILPSSEQDSKLLPLGLKADQQISRLRVGAGGEVQERSARDIGRLKSLKVGKYSLERIVI
jgi:hypothetical protein